MGADDSRAGSDAGFGSVIGTWTRGRGRGGMDEIPHQEVLPQGAAAGATCPRCGDGMRVLPARLAAKVPTRMVGCPSCGFVGLQAGSAD